MCAGGVPDLLRVLLGRPARGRVTSSCQVLRRFSAQRMSVAQSTVSPRRVAPFWSRLATITRWLAWYSPSMRCWRDCHSTAGPHGVSAKRLTASRHPLTRSVDRGRRWRPSASRGDVVQAGGGEVDRFGCGLYAARATVAGTTWSVVWCTVESQMTTRANAPLDRVAERNRAVALARHYREAEDLSIAQIAERLGRSPATIKGYF